MCLIHFLRIFLPTSKSSCQILKIVSFVSEWGWHLCKSMGWNASVHKLDLSQYCHVNEFDGNGARTYVNSMGKKNLYRKFRGGSNPQHCIMQDSDPNTLPTELFQSPIHASNFQNVIACDELWHGVLDPGFTILTPPCCHRGVLDPHFRILTPQWSNVAWNKMKPCSS